MRLSKSFKRSLKRKLIIAGLVLIGIQFLRPPKNLGEPPVDGDFFAHFPAPPEVQKLIVASCYDCHTERTTYPWYAEIQPVGWWLNTHVRGGKSHFNFGKMPGYSLARASTRFEQIAMALHDERMPLPSYASLHPDARLTPEQRKTLVNWAVDHGERLDNLAKAEKAKIKAAVPATP